MKCLNKIINTFKSSTKKHKVILLIALLCLIYIGYKLFPSKHKSISVQPVPVIATIAEQKIVPVQVEVVGSIQSHAMVSLKSLVDGEIFKIHFSEGQKVKKGDVLFEIDPRNFINQVNLAKANLEGDKASMENAIQQEKRYKELLKSNYVAEQEYDQIRTTKDTSLATVLADKAALDNAKLQLQYSRITSPIDGKTGIILIQKGNIVKANDAPLVVINQISPIYVDFFLAEKYFQDIKKYKDTLKVFAVSPVDGKTLINARLKFIDNAIDNTTGTIKLRGILENKDEMFWPGQFVRVKFKFYDQNNAIVVPAESVQTGPDGQFIFVINSDSTVTLKHVKISYQDELIAVIAEGIKPGETVVTQGQLRLVSGTKVKIDTAK